MAQLFCIQPNVPERPLILGSCSRHFDCVWRFRDRRWNLHFQRWRVSIPVPNANIRNHLIYNTTEILGPICLGLTNQSTQSLGPIRIQTWFTPERVQKEDVRPRETTVALVSTIQVTEVKVCVVRMLHDRILLMTFCLVNWVKRSRLQTFTMVCFCRDNLGSKWSVCAFDGVHEHNANHNRPF